MGEPIRGSLGVASSFQITEEMEALDRQSKQLFYHKEVSVDSTIWRGSLHPAGSFDRADRVRAAGKMYQYLYL